MSEKLDVFEVAGVVMQIGGAIGRIRRIIEPALDDGRMTPDEAEDVVWSAWEALEREARRDLLAVRINGDDAIDERAEELLVKGIARVVADAASRDA